MKEKEEMEERKRIEEISRRDIQEKLLEEVNLRVNEMEEKIQRFEQRLGSQAEQLKQISLPVDFSLRNETVKYESRKLQEMYSRTENELRRLDQKLREANISLKAGKNDRILFDEKMKEMMAELGEFRKKRFILPFIGCLMIIQALIILYLFLFL